MEGMAAVICFALSRTVELSGVILKSSSNGPHTTGLDGLATLCQEIWKYIKLSSQVFLFKGGKVDWKQLKQEQTDVEVRGVKEQSWELFLLHKVSVISWNGKISLIQQLTDSMQRNSENWSDVTDWCLDLLSEIHGWLNIHDVICRLLWAS